MVENNISVIIPALNEEKAIGKVIEAIKMLPIECEVVVVDNGSMDKTVEIAESLGVRVLHESKKGKGMAIRTGIEHTDTLYGVMIDADGTYPIDVIPTFCGMLLEYDVVKGHRCWCENKAMTKMHKFGNRVLSLLASVLYGRRVRDVCSGLWAFRLDKIREFNLTSAGFTLEADLFVNSVRTGCRLKELPIKYGKRIQGDKAKLVLGDGFRIGWFLIKKRWGL